MKEGSNLDLRRGSIEENFGEFSARTKTIIEMKDKIQQLKDYDSKFKKEMFYIQKKIELENSPSKRKRIIIQEISQFNQAQKLLQKESSSNVVDLPIEKVRYSLNTKHVISEKEQIEKLVKSLTLDLKQQMHTMLMLGDKLKKCKSRKSSKKVLVEENKLQIIDTFNSDESMKGYLSVENRNNNIIIKDHDELSSSHNSNSVSSDEHVETVKNKLLRRKKTIRRSIAVMNKFKKSDQKLNKVKASDKKNSIEMLKTIHEMPKQDENVETTQRNNELKIKLQKNDNFEIKYTFNRRMPSSDNKRSEEEKKKIQIFKPRVSYDEQIRNFKERQMKAKNKIKEISFE